MNPVSFVLSERLGTNWANYGYTILHERISPKIYGKNLVVRWPCSDQIPVPRPL